MAWGTWRGWPFIFSGAGYVTPAQLPAYMPQWIGAGAWLADPANSQANTVNKPYGSGPGNTYNIYPTIDFPQVSVGGAQYWTVGMKPNINWTSTQIRFRVHFIVDQTISLPGGYRFTLGVRRQPDPSAPSGAKTYGSVDYTCLDSNIPRWRITALSSPITIASAVATDGLALEITRGVNPTSDESDSAYMIGMELHYV